MTRERRIFSGGLFSERELYEVGGGSIDLDDLFFVHLYFGFAVVSLKVFRARDVRPKLRYGFWTSRFIAYKQSARSRSGIGPNAMSLYTQRTVFVSFILFGRNA